ncbi:MAG: stage II sporulation protein M [Candidatus Thorarchaeota archaeon]
MVRKKQQRQAKSAESQKQDPKTKVEIEAASPGSRFLVGILDFVILLCGSTLLAVAIGGDPLFFNLALSYFISSASLYSLLTSNSALLGFTVLLLLSFAYFTLEGIIGFSLGKRLFGLRLAGKRTLRKVIARSIVKSIPVLSFIDFLFVYRNLKYTQRFSDQILELGVAKLTVRTTNKVFYLDERNKAYLISGFILFFIPLITYVVYGVGAFSSTGHVSAPAPNSNFNYEPNLNFWVYILVNNIYLAYTYYFLGGLFLCLPTILHLFYQGLIDGIFTSGTILSYPQFLLFGVFPHLLFEGTGFAHLIASGLIVSETLLDLFMRYRRGESIASNRTFLRSQLIRIFKFSLLGGLLLLVGSWIETYVTPLILLAFYFY